MLIRNGCKCSPSKVIEWQLVEIVSLQLYCDFASLLNNVNVSQCAKKTEEVYVRCVSFNTRAAIQMVFSMVHGELKPTN